MFNPLKIENGRINVHETEMNTVGSAALARGTVCVLTDGRLVAATGTTKPTHITLAAGESGKRIPTGRIADNQVYETTITVSPASLAVGAKVQLVGGTSVNATTTDGVATIVDLLDASAAGDIIHVRF